MMMEYLLGIDIGTSGARAALVSASGEVIEACEISHGFEAPEVGWAEQNAEVYWSSFCEVVSTLLERSRIKAHKIVGLGISGLTPDCLPVNDRGDPLAPAILWLDRRAIKESEYLKSYLGEDEIVQLTGNGIDPYFGLVKLLWLKNNMGEIYEKSYKIVNVKDFIVGRLTGKFVSDYSDAALGGVAFDIKKRQWDAEILREIGLNIDKLPALYKSDEIVGSVTPEASHVTGIPPGIPVVAGAPDGFANLVSMGVVDVGDSGMSLGTSGVWGVAHKGDNFAREILTCPAASDPELLISFAALATSGGVYKWFKDNIATSETFLGNILHLEPYEIMNIQAETSPPGANGLILLPYFAGERTPIWDPLARGVVFGLSLTHTRGDLYRSVFEGIGYAFLDNWQVMEKTGIRLPKQVRLSGGGAKSKLLREILASVLGVPMVLLEDAGSAEVGDAFIAGKGVGVFESYDEIKKGVKIREEIEPDYSLNRFYKDIYTRIYKELYPALKKFFPGLVEIAAKV